MGTREQAPLVAKAYVAQLRELLLGLGVSDVRMEQGSLRCDVNLSLAPAGSGRSGTRTETKNVNSLRSVERAVRYEIGRQAARAPRPAGRSCRRPGTGTRTPGSPRRAARSPTPRTTATSPSRTWCRWRRRASGSSSCAAALPEPPRERRARLQQEWGFSDLEMRDTVGAGALGLVEETIAAGASPASARKWWLSEMARRANEQGVELTALPVTPADVARVQALVDEGKINDKLARQVLRRRARRRGRPRTRSSRRAGSRSSPTRARCPRPSTAPSRRTPTWPTRSATARSPRPVR